MQDTLPEDLKNRIQFQSHDFWQPQQVEDADVFLLRQILHDHDDPRAIAILRCIVPAMRNCARNIVHDFIVPERETTDPDLERTIREVEDKLEENKTY